MSQPNPVKKPSGGVTDALARAGRYMLSLLVENWPVKLLSILIAVALWAGLISQDPTLTREKRFNDVAINVIGSDTLTRNGYIVLDDLDEVLGDVDIIVSVPQGQYSKAQSSNYSVRIDLSRITSTGEQEVRILSTNSTTYGTVTEIAPKSVTLTVDEYVTRYRIPVSVVTENAVAEGFWANEPSTDPPTVAISGPKSLVDRVACVQVIADQSLLPAREGESRRALPYVLLDAEGAEVQSSLLEVTTEGVLLDSVIVEQQVYPTRTAIISELGLVTGTPAEGYEIKGIYITPATLTIAGRASVIENMNLFYASATVSVDGLTESVTKAVSVRRPSTLKYYSTDTVSVAVEIGPVMTERTLTDVPLELTGLAAGLQAEANVLGVNVHLMGTKLFLDSLTDDELVVLGDLSGIAVPGTYEVTLQCVIGGSEGENFTCEVVPGMVQVTVTAAAENSPE